MKHLFAFLALALVCLNTTAIDVDTPGTIYVYDEVKETSIKIVNSSGSAQDFSIQFSAPTQFELSEYTGRIAANSSKTARLSIYPRSDLLGQTYQSMLEVTLGNEKHVKTINIVFREEQQAEETGGKEEPTDTGTTGFLILPALSDELLLNIFLAVIAAVLLIAFIARFIKRMEGR